MYIDPEYARMRSYVLIGIALIATGSGLVIATLQIKAIVANNVLTQESTILSEQVGQLRTVEQALQDEDAHRQQLEQYRTKCSKRLERRLSAPHAIIRAVEAALDDEILVSSIKLDGNTLSIEGSACDVKRIYVFVDFLKHQPWAVSMITPTIDHAADHSARCIFSIQMEVTND